MSGNRSDRTSGQNFTAGTFENEEDPDGCHVFGPHHEPNHDNTIVVTDNSLLEEEEYALLDTKTADDSDVTSGKGQQLYGSTTERRELLPQTKIGEHDVHSHNDNGEKIANTIQGYYPEDVKNGVTSAEGRRLESRELNLEGALEALGPRGRYQLVQWTLQIFSSFIYIFPLMGFVFIGYQPDYQCSTVENISQLLPHLNLEDNGSDVITAVNYQECSIDVTVNVSGVVRSHSLDCPNGVNFSAPIDTSFLTEWLLVCSKAGLSELAQSIVIIGCAAGGIIFSRLSDRCGRKKVYVVSIFALVLSFVAVSLAHHYYLFLALRLLSGFFAMGVELSAYTMFVELLPQQWRFIASTVDSTLWAAGGIVMATVAYVMEGLPWRHVNYAYSAVFLYSLLLPFFLDESMRWLEATCQTAQLERILRKACRQNGKDFDIVRNILYCNVSSEAPSCSYATLDREGGLNREWRDEETTLDNKELREEDSGGTTESVCLNTVNSVLGSSGNRNIFGSFEIKESHDPDNQNAEIDGLLKASSHNRNKLGEANEQSTVVCRAVLPVDCNSLIEVRNTHGDSETCSNDCEKYHITPPLDSEESTKVQAKKMEKSLSEKYSVLQFFKHRILLLHFLIVTLVWLTNNMYYYGLMFGSSRLHGNRFLNFGILTIVEVPSTFLTLFLMRKFGRKLLGTIFNLMSGGFLFLSIALAHLAKTGAGQTSAVVSQYVGKFSASGATTVLYVHAMEVFPTLFRSTGVGLASSLANILSMTAPFLLLLEDKVSWAPGVFLASLCIFSAIATRFLPETRHRKLPDTIEEMQQWEKRDENL